MPFDNTSFKETPVKSAEEIAILDGMAYRLREPRLWCKDSLRKGVSRCLLGILNEEDHGSYMHHWAWHSGEAQLRPPADRVLARLSDLANTGGRLSRANVVKFNNAPETTHADVLNLIARARESFEREQS